MDLTIPQDGTLLTVEELIGPERAQELLDSMPPNRRLRPAVVDGYARDMLAGNWRRNGESIKIDTNNCMIDGDHRCHAIIQTGLEIWMSVTYGLQTEDREYLDVGAPRKTSDVLDFLREGDERKYKNSTTLAASLRLGILDSLGYIENSSGLKTGGGTYRQTRAEEMAYLEQHPELPDVVNRYTQVARRIGLPTSAFCYAMALLEDVSADGAKLFAKSLDENATNGEGDARNALLRFTRANAVAKGRIGAGETLWLVFTTWNAWRTDKEVKRLNPFGGTKERPTPREIPTPV